MNSQATHEDANLILKLYDLRREPTLRDARRWIAQQAPFASREQWLGICPTGSQENAYFRMVVTYWEMASSFVANGVLNAELFYRSNNMELLLVWVKIRNMVDELRQVANNPLSYSHIEKVASGFIAFLNENAPGAFDTFAANVSRVAAPAVQK
jgi:hypothetical protein